MAILELMRAEEPRNMRWLTRALQAAVELEFFTVPPYLTALWSVCDQQHFAARTLRAVVYEEMQHLSLACNLLAAVGGTPRLNQPPAVPEYPRPLPGGVKPALTVGLSGLTPQLVKVFMQIEEPEVIVQIEELMDQPPGTFPRIGAFYEAIAAAFHDLKPDIRVDRQLAGPLAPLEIGSLADVDAAIRLIRVQGEGTDVSPAADSPEELAHYYRFQQLDEGREFEYDPLKKKFHKGKALPFPDVFPVAEVPAGGYRNDEVAADVADRLRQFDRAYTQLLDQLQAAYDGGGQAGLWRAVEWMFSLEGAARALMAMPIPGTDPPLTYGPNFRYLGNT